MAINVIVVLTAVVAAGYFLFSRRLAHSSDWNATVIPLASIMGSAPLLGGAVGNAAVLCMAGLLALAFLVGGAIRFNIQHFEPIQHTGHGPAQTLAFADEGRDH